MSRATVLGAALVGFVLFVPTSDATIIYNVSHSFAANGPLNLGAGTIDIGGTITSDGTLGAISTANLVSWNIDFSNPGGTQTTFNLTQANSMFNIAGGASLTATATTLDFTVPVDPGFGFPQINLFDTVGGPDISWSYLGQNFLAPGAFLEIEVILDSDGNGALPFTQHKTTIDPHTTPFMGDLTGGAGVGSPVPEPSTLTLLGIGAFALVGYGRRRRQAARKRNGQ